MEVCYFISHKTNNKPKIENFCVELTIGHTSKKELKQYGWVPLGSFGVYEKKLPEELAFHSSLRKAGALPSFKCLGCASGVEK